MPQNHIDTVSIDDDFSLADLDVSELTVVNVHDSAALPESCGLPPGTAASPASTSSGRRRARSSPG
ncbi:hypothetical protein [Micromonospora sp. SD12]|uniref:hypothetical protein n=1 Tax=Micromonospora sp. SD12 TaxID=3452216 RepID=UPI003F88D12F